MARGATFDPDLERRVGEVMGIEARAQGCTLSGAVCVNLLRHPAWGRAQETYGEDPHHLGEMGAALYVVRDGHCMVLLPSGEERRIEKGNYFGEMGLLKLKARTANVVAGEGGSTLIRIDRECMQILFDRYPALCDSFEAVRTARMIDAGMEEGKSGPERVPVLVNLIKAVKDIILPW